jgi:indolepyruvate ferredoxin oxidoreductase beta subunit
MEYNLILAGVGGQGILTIAQAISVAVVRRGWHVKQAEVHGMSQRGGAVQSHLRFSDKEIFSDLVPWGRRTWCSRWSRSRRCATCSTSRNTARL